VFFWEMSLGRDIEAVLAHVAFVPARFWYAPALVPSLFSALVSMFLHGGWLHLGGNMLYLWIFGDNIEDRLGHFRYLVFYLACGFAATLAHAIVNPGSRLPSIGASGAIAGVLGAYILLFPRGRVTTLIPVFIFIMVREVPAIFVLGIWFVFQLFVGVSSLGVSPEQAGGVAYFAHIGGFVAGAVRLLVVGGLPHPPATPISPGQGAWPAAPRQQRLVAQQPLRS